MQSFTSRQSFHRALLERYIDPLTTHRVYDQTDSTAIQIGQERVGMEAVATSGWHRLTHGAGTVVEGGRLDSLNDGVRTVAGIVHHDQPTGSRTVRCDYPPDGRRDVGWIIAPCS